MQALFLLLAASFALAGPTEHAGPRSRASSGASVSRTAASVSPLAAAQECMQLAINGRFEADCATDHDADQCVGLQLALRNALRRDNCRARAGEGCLEYSYKQNAQSQWISVAAGYLAEFGQCVRAQYGGDAATAFREALADPSFRDRAAQFDDGSAHFGLRNGEILERMLREESLGSILKSSPAWHHIEAKERERMLAAAENPTATHDAFDTGAEAVAQLMNKGKGAGANSWNRTRPDLPLSPGLPAAASAEPAPSAPANDPVLTTLPLPARAPAAAGGNTFVRRLQANPYSLGLDLSLFDRVSTAYQKRMPEMRGINDFVKSLPKREPRTVKDLLEQNKGIEI